MRAAAVLAVAAACSGAPVVVPDADVAADARTLHDVIVPGCPVPPGVTWIDTSWDPVTAVLPAGLYFEDPVAGCMWVVVSSEPDAGFRVETATLGCSVILHLPPDFAADGNGHGTLVGAGSATISINDEACFSAGRGAWASGTMTLRIDGAARTLTTWGFGFDTSSSPASCGCP